MSYIEESLFADIRLSDPFFDSLKEDYAEFSNWFAKKSLTDSTALVLKRDGKDLDAFLYLKVEEGVVDDVEPALLSAKRLKVGTFKVNAVGTRLGERFVKKILDYAIHHNVEEIYVTIFEKHLGLIDILKRYGFEKKGVKNSTNGTELVLIKSWLPKNNILLDYPRIYAANTQKYLLAIYPEYHTRLFPDSILNSEKYNILEDKSHTNSIHKVYVCFMDVSILNRGDILVIYRTSDKQGPAHYRSVVTSVCVVEEVRTKNSFNSFADYLSYCQPYSIFSESELLEWYSKKAIFTIKIAYNAAIEKRITRGNLIENMGLNEAARWGFLKISDGQFEQIITKGKVNENIVVY